MNLLTTLEIATSCGHTSAAIMARAKARYVTPITRAGRTFLWTRTQARILRKPGKRGAPKGNTNWKGAPK